MVHVPAESGPGPAGGRLTAETAARALHIRVTGIVQGVGFRPYVHRLAARAGLAGWVRNDAGAVTIHVEGTPEALDRFAERLAPEAPVLARIDSLERTMARPTGDTGFRVLASAAVDPGGLQPVPADVALCEACLAELLDPANRRFRYPFITCTDCGPRFTVIEAVPYQRDRTSMRVFEQCADCRREFRTPFDRRFHSETNCCPACGPSLWLEPASAPGDPIEAAAALLGAGRIIAVRGLGGFHLAVDATDDQAVRRLRERKHRETKPLAVMVRTLEQARALAEVSEEEAVLLGSRARPIVLLAARAGPLAPSVHPGLQQVGILLAYTPLHHLLLEAVGRPLIMTSGNLSDEPIAAGIAEGRSRLGGIADAFLMHDREIVARCDDSVVRVAGTGPVLLRRARGHTPLPIDLPVESPRHLLAVGPHLKNTATLVRGRHAFVTPHVGDLDSLESVEHFRHLVAACQRLFHVRPEVVVRDLHPGYLSTRLAEETGLPVLAVQHHHAHLAAVLAEHGRTAPAIGLAFDGTGHGEDGAVWGAEVLVGDLAGYRRLAHLRYAPLPGGDLAARRPWRVALGYRSLEPSLGAAFAAAFAGVPAREVDLAQIQIARGLNAPPASSMGRLFDAAAAILGLRHEVGYEGQAAMELEALAGRRRGCLLPFPVTGTDAPFVLDPLPLLAALGEGLAAGGDRRELAASFHESVAWTTIEVAARVRTLTGVGVAALGGGVFQNARLLDAVAGGLVRRGFEVLVAQRLGPNDGAISYGQAAVAASILQR